MSFPASRPLLLQFFVQILAPWFPALSKTVFGLKGRNRFTPDALSFLASTAPCNYCPPWPQSLGAHSPQPSSGVQCGAPAASACGSPSAQGAEHVRRSGPRRPDDARRGAEERPSAPLRTRPSALTVPSPCRARGARSAGGSGAVRAPEPLAPRQRSAQPARNKDVSFPPDRAITKGCCGGCVTLISASLYLAIWLPFQDPLKRDIPNQPPLPHRGPRSNNKGGPLRGPLCARMPGLRAAPDRDP